MTNSPCILPSCKHCAWSAYLNSKEMYCTKRFPIMSQRQLRKQLTPEQMPSENSGCPIYKRNSWRDNLRPDVTKNDIARLEKYYE
ncbi:MAG: hypothetical protein IJS13_08740 [Paludibacteraceae bacterium]|nr:hypothetical protein [Paludibacteraceae bacterium]